MDYLLNDEIFGHDNDDLLQSHLDSELWPEELIDDLHNANQFFNDQDFDINQMSLSFDEDNKNVIKTQMCSNIFQVSPGIFSRGVSPEPELTSNSHLKLPSKAVNFINKRKSSTDSRDQFDMCIRGPKRFDYGQGSDNEITDGISIFNGRYKIPHGSKSTINIREDIRNIAKVKRPDNITVYQIASSSPNCGDRNSMDRIKYSLSPSTSSPDSAIDSSAIGNGLNLSNNSGDLSFLSYNSNNAHNRFYELKYKSHKDNSFHAKLSNCTRFFQSPIPQTGVLILTEEEKRTLLSEGYPIPSRLPLTKHEERNLKKVRRKIKNKISAQESRRKKKEYMEALEKKVEIFAHENNELRKRLETQENTNKSLLGQLRHLQQMLGRASSNTASTCVMVFLLCFSLILVGLPEINQPMKLPQSGLIVGNIHKFGYGSLVNRERSQMTAMKRYFPPDIDGFVNTSCDRKESILPLETTESRELIEEDKGIEPLDSLAPPATGQRKSILLGNVKEEEDECVQYGPRYFWWLLQSPNLNTDDSQINVAISATEISNLSEINGAVVPTIVIPRSPTLVNGSLAISDQWDVWSNASTVGGSLQISVVTTSIAT